MDPITVIVSALVAGASASLKETAADAVKDSYNGLKTLVIDLWKKSKAEEAAEEKEKDANLHLNAFAENPEMFKSTLEKKLREVMPEPESQLVEQANAFMELLKQNGSSSKYDNMTIKDNKGVQVGDGNTQNITFN